MNSRRGIAATTTLIAALLATLLLPACGGDDGDKQASAGCVSDVPADALVVPLQSLGPQPSGPQQQEITDYLCAQLEALGVSGAVDADSGSFIARITGDPQAVSAARTTLGIGKLFGIYDWERNLVAGPMSPPKATAEAARRGGEFLAVRDADGKAYVIRNSPAIGEAEVEGAALGSDDVTHEPTVDVQLTPSGQQAFTALTRDVAKRRGHFAVIYRDQLLALPELDPAVAAKGIDASEGVQVPGNGSAEESEQIAKLLDLGPPPVQLFNTSAI